MDTFVEQINQYLEHSLDTQNEGIVKEAMYYSLLAPGKRIRPLLFLKVLQAYGIDYTKYLDIACSVEMIHACSLIHDDLPAMDDDDLRRGRKTCHIQFDEATAILAGDALLNHAYYVLSTSQLEDGKKIECIRLLSSCTGQAGMIYGQQQDLFFETKQATIDELKDIHIHKTAKLIMAPLMMAGVIVDPGHIEVFEKLGRILGLAYQIQDDVLDVIGDEALIGKKVGSDENNNKSTYVSLLGLEEANKQVEHYFKEALECVYQLKINHGVLIDIIQMILKRVK